MGEVVSGIAYLLVILSLLVIAHELGHFGVARAFKIRVEDFSLFWGPVIWRICKRGDTVYNLRAIPIGGFVRIAGMEADDVSNGDPVADVMRRAREAGEEEGPAPDPDDPGLFSSRPIYQRALVILAGPVASLIFGYVLFCLVGMTVGLPGGKASTQVADVRRGGPAYRAGLRIGDRIVSIDGVAMRSGEQMVDTIHRSINKELTLRVDRRGERIIAYVKPEPATGDALRTFNNKPTGLIGITPNFEPKRLGVGQSIRAGTVLTVAYVMQLGSIFAKPADLGDNLGGPIAMGQMTTVVQRLGIAHLALISAQFSLGLGIMNLLPIPVLDGGHLMLFGFEKLRRRRLSLREVYRVQMVGVAILVSLVVVVMYNDIARTLTGQAMR